mmetsp:Transcript_25069/g.55153  ORF Transcript_25069/g.55153 Transcript_25069/m.55153 type:complete len:249 (+) Transcript_25069:701-1447(+)
MRMRRAVVGVRRAGFSERYRTHDEALVGTPAKRQRSLTSSIGGLAAGLRSAAVFGVPLSSRAAWRRWCRTGSPQCARASDPLSSSGWTSWIVPTAGGPGARIPRARAQPARRGYPATKSLTRGPAPPCRRCLPRRVLSARLLWMSRSACRDRSRRHCSCCVPSGSLRGQGVRASQQTARPPSSAPSRRGWSRCLRRFEPQRRWQRLMISRSLSRRSRSNQLIWAAGKLCRAGPCVSICKIGCAPPRFP